MTLHAWLASLKARRASITIQAGHPTTRPFLPSDRRHLDRHRHALVVAAAGTHPAWWNHVARGGPTPTRLDDIPTTPHPPSGDGLAFACAQCGQPAETLDEHLFAWCETHGQ